MRDKQQNSWQVRLFYYTSAHLHMECQYLLTERNNMFYKIFDELSVQKVDIFSLEDKEILEILLDH
jgi:hypothetical protein